MKRKCAALMLVVSVVAGLGIASLAQAATVHYGAFGGLGLSKMRIDPEPTVGRVSLKAPAFGATVRFELSPTLSIEPGLMYVSDGFSWGESEATDYVGNPLGTFEQLSVLEHVQVPVLFRYTLPSSGKVRAFGFAGPYGSIHLNEYTRVTGAIEQKLDTDGLRAAHAGVILGGGAQTTAGPGQLELQVRYDVGLTSLQESGLPGNAYANSFRFLLGWSR
ncbi:MAG: PorT family protein [Candidatus Eisenbacteria bacterium]|uniref:PorT family protein n=1 Tax=Eiseniibacteriota bacterium TaxID=2212470 RepID=A0A933SD51_UNCEI|nr:PorT family protein [Candidatus Eisenbacteria bacterium]